MSKYVVLLAVLSILLLSVLAAPSSCATDNSVTLYLHKAGSIGTVNTKGTAGQILNTTAYWSSSVQENSSQTASGAYFSCYFYLYPTLAGSLVLHGAPASTTFFKANASASDLTLITTLSKVAADGASTQLSTKSDASESVGTSYAALTSTHSSVSATVASGFTLKLNVTVGGSASNLTLTVGYDTLATNSRLVLVATDPLTVSLSSSKSVYEWEDGATLTSTVTDVFGGYDVAAAPTIAFSTPSGLTYTTSASSVGDSQYTNTYTYTIPKLNSGAGAGTWRATSSVSDRGGNSYASAGYSFELRAPGGTGPSPTLTLTPGDQTNVGVAVIAVVAVAAIVAVAATGRKRKRRHR